jgi:hypothetical protein
MMSKTRWEFAPECDLRSPPRKPRFGIQGLGLPSQISQELPRSKAHRERIEPHLIQAPQEDGASHRKRDPALKKQGTELVD